jgi:hypothetical protein
VQLPAVHTDHPEVRTIQPTWHCVLRFRQRASPDPGTDVVLEELRQVLADAHIDRWPPSWAAGQEAERWAVSGRYAFPLALGPDGVASALTCLIEGV